MCACGGVRVWVDACVCVCVCLNMCVHAWASGREKSEMSYPCASPCACVCVSACVISCIVLPASHVFSQSVPIRLCLQSVSTCLPFYDSLFAA